MEILYVTIHLAIISKGFSLHFGSIIQTLPPVFPEEFRKRILDVYSKNPEVFGDPVTKGAPHAKGMKFQKVHQVNNAIRTDEKTSEKPATTAAVSTPALKAITMPPVPVPAIPLPVPIPIQMYPRYPQMPIVLPMRTYYERVIHQHPPLDKIKQIIENDELRWEKYNKGGGKLHVPKHSDDSESDSSDTDSSNDRHHWQYYDDFLHIKG